jgi:hypothetical protein
MILTEVRDYLRDRRHVTLDDVATHFDVDTDLARDLVDRWVRKGRVVCQQPSAAQCSLCDSCKTECLEVYHWVG